MSTRTRFLGGFLFTVLSSIAILACGGSETPEAPPGVPMNPPQEDPALAEMMGAVPTSAPTTPATAASSTPAPSASTSAGPAPSASAKAPKPKPSAAPAPPPAKH